MNVSYSEEKFKTEKEELSFYKALHKTHQIYYFIKKNIFVPIMLIRICSKKNLAQNVRINE